MRLRCPSFEPHGEGCTKSAAVPAPPPAATICSEPSRSSAGGSHGLPRLPAPTGDRPKAPLVRGGGGPESAVSGGRGSSINPASDRSCSSRKSRPAISAIDRRWRSAAAAAAVTCGEGSSTCSSPPPSPRNRPTISRGRSPSVTADSADPVPRPRGGWSGRMASRRLTRLRLSLSSSAKIGTCRSVRTRSILCQITCFWLLWCLDLFSDPAQIY